MSQKRKSEAFEKQNIIILLILLIFFVLVLLIFIFYPKNSNLAIVSSVVDGDTIHLTSGDTVRLLFVDTPEINQSGYEEAKDFLESLLLGKEVRLEKDVSNVDKYNRLLRYVYLKNNSDEIFINKEIIDKGLGKLFIYGNDTCEKLINS